MRNFFAFFMVAVAIMFTVACDNGISPVDDNNITDNDNNVTDDSITDNDSVTTEPLTIQGMVAKGPLVKGSTLYFTILSETGEQVGLILNATTDDDLGRFAYKVTATVAPEVVNQVCKISATGYFYDEIGDRLSNAPITLEALFRITDSEVQDARINLLTHMTVKRTLELMGEGTIFEDAQAQAEDELIAEMGVFYAPADEDPRKPAIEMDITTDPYPLAIACIFGQAAYNIAKDSAEFYGKYQQLLNDTSADLTDGTLTTDTKSIIIAGEEALDASTCATNLQKYLEEKTGNTYTLPDPNSSVDSDNDGIPNETDPDLDGDGVENATDCVKGATDYALINVLRDVLCVKKIDNTWGCFYHDEGHSFLTSETDTTITSAWTNSFNKVANGINHLCGIDTDQKLWSWSSWETPIKVDDNSWKNVFAGQNRTCAIDSSDQLYCWQDNLIIAGTKVNDDTDWSSLSLGNDKFYATKTDGTLWYWNFEEVPVQIGTDLWKFISNDSAYAIKTDGTLWYVSDFTAPIQVGSDTDWTSVYGTCAIKADNTLWCWSDTDKTPATKVSPGWSCGQWQLISHHYHELDGELLCGIKTDRSLWCLKDGDLLHIGDLPL